MSIYILLKATPIFREGIEYHFNNVDQTYEASKMIGNGSTVKEIFKASFVENSPELFKEKLTHHTVIHPHKEDEKSDRPLIGLTSEYLHKQTRLMAIQDAIKRYLAEKAVIPLNWIAEEYAIRGWLENWEKETHTK